MVQLFVVESPAKAKTIARYLGADFRVVATCGHVRDLPKDRLGIDLERFEAEYIITKPDVVRRIQAALREADALWLATDGDREGEGIAAHLLACLDVPPGMSVRRAVFHEITPGALRRSLETARDLAAPLVDAQNCRRLLDRLVGYQVSPLLWKKLGRRTLSAGRVQSAALHLVVAHQETIDAFVPSETVSIRAQFEHSQTPFWADYEGEDPSEAESWMRTLEAQAWTVEDATTHEESRSPPPPFATSALQQEAAVRLRTTAKQTMRAAQDLYEKGHITYMRTDSTALSAAAQAAALDWIRAHHGDAYAAARQYRSRAAHAQEAHEAIRPTRMEVTELSAGAGTATEKRLYRLIWLRTVASQMAAARDAVQTVRIASGDDRFVARFRHCLFDGWRRLDRGAEAEETTAATAAMEVGTPVVWRAVERTCQQSFPPRRLTEGSLIRKLEEAGIGRPSTYEPTLGTLEQRGYLERAAAHAVEVQRTSWTLRRGELAPIRTEETVRRAENGTLVPSEAGRAVHAYLSKAFPELPDPAYTSQMEADLDRVAAGEHAGVDLLRAYQARLLDRIREAAAAAAPEGRLPPKQVARRAAGYRTLGAHPQRKGWTVRVYPEGRFGPFVMAVPPPRSRTKPVFASLPKDRLPVEQLTLDAAIGLLG